MSSKFYIAANLEPEEQLVGCGRTRRITPKHGVGGSASNCNLDLFYNSSWIILKKRSTRSLERALQPLRRTFHFFLKGKVFVCFSYFSKSILYLFLPSNISGN